MYAHFVDEHLLVVEKPAGVLSVPGRGEDKQDCVWRRAQASWPDALVVHRLDCATSGLMLLARSSEAQRALSIQFQNRQTFKRYQAWVFGWIEQDAGQIELPLRCDWERRPIQIVDSELGKSALTFFRVLERFNQYGTRLTRIALYPITGRSHQLRVHMQALGHPILGDDLYANRQIEGAPQRLHLHADLLEFYHPVTNERISLTSTAPL